MKRLKLLGAMAAFAALMVFAVWLGSPYEPVIAPVAEIEKIWAIEDEREESETPLVRRLYNGGVPLGFDRESSTFYCTLGLGQGDAWPDIHLTAESGKDVRLVFVDDYSYDWCSEAIAEGYPYQAMAYTDDAFWYFNIVFTGLPIISVYSDQKIGKMDTPAKIMFSVFGRESVGSAANMHLRGGGSMSAEKKNLRVEFTREINGKDNMIEVPGFGVRENILLNPMAYEETMLRDRACWHLYGDILGEAYDGAFDERETAYAEMFMNNEYQGVYLMMEPIDAQEELLKEDSSALLTDSVYRTVIKDVYERPVIQNPLRNSSRYELRYEPAGVRKFAPLEAYLDLLTEHDDAIFAEKAACIDMEGIARYALLRQVAGLTDNIDNNLYIWAKSTSEGIKYVPVPWDLDMSWGIRPEVIGANNEKWLTFVLFDRLIELDAQGFRQLLVRRWRELRKDVFTQEHIMQIFEQYQSELTDSGALLRNAERWGTRINEAVLEQMNGFVSTRIELLDAVMDGLADGKELEVFLLDGDDVK